jgi:hypothetical protein
VTAPDPKTVAVEVMEIEADPPVGIVSDAGTPAIDTETNETGVLAGTIDIVVD